MRQQIIDRIQESIRTKEAICRNGVDVIVKMAEAMAGSFKNGGKAMFLGNGGSAADSQHLAAEFVGRFKRERSAMSAIALHCDTSVLTAISNDYHYDMVFVRQIESLGRAGDIAVGISTSGNSKNIIAAIRRAREKGITTIGLSGGDGGELARIVDMSFVVPSHSTPRIQESHITVGHILCELTEDILYAQQDQSDHPNASMSLEEKLKRVRLLALDFDGVLTDGCVYVNQDGTESVRCSRKDGLGIEMLREAHIRVCVISKERNPVVAARCDKLQIPCWQAVVDSERKREVLQRIIERDGIAPVEVVYMGDDVNDLSPFQYVGCCIAVADAHPKLRESAHYITKACGGQHAVREVCDMILAAKKAL